MKLKLFLRWTVSIELLESCGIKKTLRVLAVCVISVWVPALEPSHFLWRFSSSQHGYKVGHRNVRAKPEAEAGTKGQECEYEVDARTNAQLRHSWSKRQERRWTQVVLLLSGVKRWVLWEFPWSSCWLLASSNSTRPSWSEPMYIHCMTPATDPLTHMGVPLFCKCLCIES